MSIVEVLALPFFQRAIIGGIVVAIISGLMGVFMVLKKSTFFGETIAHASLTGVAIGLLLGFEPLLGAILFAVFLSLSLPWLEKNTNLSMDNLLGFTLSISVGLAVVLLSFLPGYQPELMSYLFGSILSVTWSGIGLISVFGVVIIGVVLRYHTLLSAVVFDQEYARLRGINTWVVNALLSTLFAITIVLCSRLVGVILVNALLILPTLIARSYARSLRELFLLVPPIAVGCVMLGLITSVVINIPTGPTIAVLTGTIFLFSTLIRRR